MNKKHFNIIGYQIILLWFLSLTFLGSCDYKKPSFSNRPNIVFLLADDLGYGELGSYGQDIIKTPELDRLAKNGMRFTNFYAGNGVCSPSKHKLSWICDKINSETGVFIHPYIWSVSSILIISPLLEIVSNSKLYPISKK